MYQHSFDGTLRPLDLSARLGAEERIGDTLAPETVNLYARKMQHVANRAANSNISDLTPEMIVRDLQERIKKQDITRVTARVEKSAALFWIAEQAQKSIDTQSSDFGRYEAAYNDVQLLKTSSLPKKSDKTSGSKLKAFPDEAVNILEEAALNQSTSSLLDALLFVRANLLVGLRPVEWLNAKFIEYEHRDAFGELRHDPSGSVMTSPALQVINAKHSAIRGNGASRTIILETLDERQCKHIKQWLQAIQRLRSQFVTLTDVQITRKIFGSMQTTVRRTLTKASWVGAMPSIYSTRHQAVANAKADHLPLRQIAALFGHSSVDTAKRHYGKKYSGYQGRTLRAAPESIAAVRRPGNTIESTHSQDPNHNSLKP